MLYLILKYFRELQRTQNDLLLENLALRQQILVLECQVKKPKFKDHDLPTAATATGTILGFVHAKRAAAHVFEVQVLDHCGMEVIVDLGAAETKGKLTAT